MSSVGSASPSSFHLEILSSDSLVNPDGKCYPFDSRGTGYRRGEGVGAVILKQLDRALADGDHIHAVIAHSGINQDGKTSGISVPSGEAQAALIKRVYAEAGLNPAKTVYVEAHGTVSILILVYRRLKSILC